MKKMISLFLTAVLICSMTVFAAAEGDASIVVNQAEGKPGDTVDVVIEIINNPGIIATKISLDYDTTQLELQNVYDGGLLGDNTYIFGNDFTEVPYNMIWEDALSRENYTDDGILVTLTFKISESADKSEAFVSVQLDEGSTFDTDINDVFFNTVDGKVLIQQENEDPTIELTDITAEIGESFCVPVIIKNNPGIIATHLIFSYDSDVLELTNVENGNVFDSSYAFFGNDLSANPYHVLWENGLAQENNNLNGTLVILTFTVLDTDKETTEIILNYDQGSTFDYGLNDVVFNTVNANVQINSSVYLIEKAESSARIEGKYIYIAKEMLLANELTADYVDIIGNGVIDCDESIVTGTEIVLKNADTNSTIKKYVAVIIGDVNSDGRCDAQDAVLTECIMNALLTNTNMSMANYYAADVNSDHIIDQNDVDKMVACGLKTESI